MANADYSEKLKHPKWQRKRLEIMRRDNFKCVLCTDGETTLHVHHKLYRKNCDPWEYEDSTFMTLCEVCHEIVEWLKKYKYDVKQVLYNKQTKLDGGLLAALCVSDKMEKEALFFSKSKDQKLKYYFDATEVLLKQTVKYMSKIEVSNSLMVPESVISVDTEEDENHDSLPF